MRLCAVELRVLRLPTEPLLFRALAFPHLRQRAKDMPRLERLTAWVVFIRSSLTLLLLR